MNILPIFNPAAEETKITAFIQSVIANTGIRTFIVGVSGGIDSAVSYALLSKVIQPDQLYAVHLYYRDSSIEVFRKAIEIFSLPKENILIKSIQEEVDTIVSGVGITEQEKEKMRIGNIMARVRMIILFDLAKEHGALVCGTENKSENRLGYFTRFGDAASDIEPISHLYKTQVYQLAKYLHVSPAIVDAKPTAGLWDGQTDEGELGFTYEEADQVLYLAFEKKMSVREIKKRGFNNAETIIRTTSKNAFKQLVPYVLP